MKTNDRINKYIHVPFTSWILYFVYELLYTISAKTKLLNKKVFIETLAFQHILYILYVEIQATLLFNLRQEDSVNNSKSYERRSPDVYAVQTASLYARNISPHVFDKTYAM